MTDQHDVQNLIDGYDASLKDLRSKRDLFTKAKGLNEQAEKLKGEADDIRDDITKEKENHKTLTEKKNKAMMTVTQAMTEKMNAVLPSGIAVVEIKEDGSLLIGWNNGKAIIPYSGLSGGEKAAFDPALCKALGGSILCVEAAEIDSTHLTDALKKYADTDIQVLVSSCHRPGIVPEGWKVVQL